jgi:hypothetical protein
MSKTRNERHGKIITLGEDMRKRIPQLFSVIYRLETTAATDGEDIEEDETFKLHTLRTVNVEGTVIINEGAGVCVNGDFDISLVEDEDDDKPGELRKKVWADKDEAIAAWELLSNLELDRAKAIQDKINATVTMLQTSVDERQY